MQTRPLRWYNFIAVNAYWLGLNIASGIITPLLLPYLVVQFMPAEYKNTYLANLRVVGLATAMLVQPLAGLFSDRSLSRWGRRRPYIAAGALLNCLFLLIIGFSPAFRGASPDDFFQNAFGVTTAYAVLMVGLVLLQISSNIGQGALQGLLPDVVPAEQRGRASGVKAVFELMPSLLILGLGVGGMIDRGQVGLVVGIIIGGFLLTMLVNVLFVRETPQATRPAGDSLRQPVMRLVGLTVLFVGATRVALWLVQASAAAIGAQPVSTTAKVALVGSIGLLAMAGSIFVGVYFGAWVGIGQEAPRRKGFIWWVINRLLFLAAVGSIQSFAQYFLADVLQIPNPAAMTTQLLAAVALFLIPSAIFGGALADRIGHRRLVGLAGLVAMAGTVLLILSPSVVMVMISGAIIGLATGSFMASNWALGTRLIPPEDAGRYLGISNLAGAGAGIVGAGIGGPVADFFNLIQPGLGYLVLFAIYAGLFGMSTVVLGKVK